MAYSRDAFTRDQQETRERDKIEKTERDEAMADDLRQTNEIASKSQKEMDTDAQENYLDCELLFYTQKGVIWV